MDEEGKLLIKELNETLLFLKEKDEKSQRELKEDIINSIRADRPKQVWHKHPIFLVIATILFGYIIANASGYASLPIKNKQSIEELERAVMAIDNIPNNNHEQININAQNLRDHIKDDELRWDRVNNRLSTSNNNIKSIVETIDELMGRKPTVTEIKPIDTKNNN